MVREAVMQGRRTAVNTGKYILMASSANLGNIFSMVIAGLILPFLPFLPLLPIQVLLTNLFYDFAQTGIPLDTVSTIFAVRTRRRLLASRPHRALAGLACGTAAFTLALPFLPGIGPWFEFVHPPAPYFAFLAAVVAAFLVATERVKRAFYARMTRTV